LRLAYVAQHSMVHLAQYLTLTPLEYMQLRFRRGLDLEMPACVLPVASQAETDRLRLLGKRHGKCGKQVEALLSRIMWSEGNETDFLYEVKWMELEYAENTFESPGRLKQLGAEVAGRI